MNKKLIAITLSSLLAFPSFANDGGVLGVAKKAAGMEDSTPIQELEPVTGEQEDVQPGFERTDIPMQINTLNATQESFDTSSATANTLIETYNPTVTYKLAVGEVLGTTIILPEYEGIKDVILGSDTFWSFVPNGSLTDEVLPRIGQVSTDMPGTDTSLTIIGVSGNVYTFYLRSYSWQAKIDPTLKIYIQDERLHTKLEALKKRKLAREKAERDRKHRIDDELRKRRLEREKADYLEETAPTPEDYDFGYQIKGGDEELSPYYVYDDGIFTYFKFDSKNSKNLNKALPVVYKVVDDSDSPTNASMVSKRTIRVEGVSNSWTLRLGEKYLCVQRREPLEPNTSNMNTVLSESL